MKLHQMSKPTFGSNFWENGEVLDCQRFVSRIKKEDSWKIALLSVRIFSIETLLEEIKPVVTK